MQRRLRISSQSQSDPVKKKQIQFSGRPRAVAVAVALIRETQGSRSLIGPSDWSARWSDRRLGPWHGVPKRNSMIRSPLEPLPEYNSDQIAPMLDGYSLMAEVAFSNSAVVLCDNGYQSRVPPPIGDTAPQYCLLFVTLSTSPSRLRHLRIDLFSSANMRVKMISCLQLSTSSWRPENPQASLADHYMRNSRLQE